MPILEIDHVQMAAPPSCEDTARYFFGVLLGLEEINKPATLAARGGCWFRVGGHQLHIGIDEEFRPARKSHPAFAVAAIEELHATLVRAGVVCTWDAALLPVKRFYAIDPWGNRLEFTEPSN